MGKLERRFARRLGIRPVSEIAADFHAALDKLEERKMAKNPKIEEDLDEDLEFEFEDEDEEDEVPAPKTKAKPVVELDDEDEFDDEDEVPAPKAKAKAVVKPIKAKPVVELDDEDEVPAPKTKAKAVVKPIKAKPAVELEDEDEFEFDDEDEDEVPAPKAKPVVELDDEDEVPAPKAKAKAVVKPIKAKPVVELDDEDEDEVPAPKAKTKAKTKAAAKPGRGNAQYLTPRSRTYQPDGVITVLVEGNPKRAKAAARFALYEDGMTVAEYEEAGGLYLDIVWDVKQGWVSVK